MKDDNDKKKNFMKGVFTLAAIGLSITLLSNVFKKAFSKNEPLISQRGKEVLADKRNKHLIDQAIKKAKPEQKEVEVILANNQQITILL